MDSYYKWQDEIIAQEYDNDENLFIANSVYYEAGILEE